MTTQESHINKYFSEIKMALMEYASNVLYIKNSHRSISHPKDQKYIVKTCALIEHSQQVVFNYIMQCLTSNNDGCLIKPFLYCEPTIAEIHINRFTSKHFLRLLDTQKLLFIETINTIFITLYNNSSLEAQSQMQEHHKKILQLFGGKSSFGLTKLFKRKTLLQPINNDNNATDIILEPNALSINHALDEQISTPLSDLHTSINSTVNDDAHNAQTLLNELNHLREKMSQLEKDKIAAEKQQQLVEAARKKLESDHIDLTENARLEREKIAAEQKQQRAETEQQLITAKKIAAEEAVRLEREKIAEEQKHQREKAEQQLIEAKKIAAEDAARVEREKIAEEQKHLREKAEQQLAEAKRIAAEDAARVEREKIAEEQQHLREKAEQQLAEAKRIAAEEAARLEREKIAAEQKRQQEQMEKDKLEHEQRLAKENEQKKRELLIEEQKARDEVARIEREKIIENQKMQQNKVIDKKQQEELQKLYMKEQELNQKRTELQEIEDYLHDKEREQQLIIQELLTISRYLNQKENELQQIIKTKFNLEQEVQKINEKLREYENQKRENAETLLQLERKRRQHAQDATQLENAWQRQAKNLQPDITLVKNVMPPRKRHSLELEEAAAKLKQTGTEERT